MRYELSDYEWTAIKPMLPNTPRGVRRVNDRRVLNGIFWVLRSGAPWRDLPAAYGPRTTCYNRFVRWRRAGVWDQIMEALAAGHDAAVQMIDTSIVRVHQHGACVADNNHQDNHPTRQDRSRRTRRYHRHRPRRRSVPGSGPQGMARSRADHRRRNLPLHSPWRPRPGRAPDGSVGCQHRQSACRACRTGPCPVLRPFATGRLPDQRSEAWRVPVQNDGDEPASVD